MAKKKKQKGIKVPNNIAQALRSDPQYRKRVAKNGEDRAEQRDNWSRKAKHKNKLDESMEFVFENFQVGDKVKVSDEALQRILDRADEMSGDAGKAEPQQEEQEEKQEAEAIVKDPKGPDGTVGIMLDGTYHILDVDELSLIVESWEEDEYEDFMEWSMVMTTSGVALPASGEEMDILNKFEGKLYNQSLDERDREVARKMVSKGLLNRRKDDKGIYFLKNDTELRRI